MNFVCPAHQEVVVSFKGTGCGWCASLRHKWRERRKERRRNSKLILVRKAR